jgi:type IVB pilus formation R64 PilN family outer membrane protein
LPGSGIPADGSVTREIEEDRLSTELSALKIVERVSISHSGAIITLSDQPAPLQVGRQTTYLARVSATSGDGGSGSTSLEPGTVNTGLLMTVLPRIVEQNKILMRLSIAITELQALETASSGGVSIQTPEISTTGFLQNAVLTSGETMVLAGFEKNDNASNENGAPGSWALGGTKNSNKAREVSIMMITAEILPEDPITVIGQ